MWQQWRVDYVVEPNDVRGVGREKIHSTPESALYETDVPDVPPEFAGNEDTLQAKEVPSTQRSDHDVVQVRTDVVNAEINLLGGNIHRLELLNYPVSVDLPDIPFGLLNDVEPDIFLAQSGLLGTMAAPNHRATFVSTKREYSLDEDDDEVRVRLQWFDPGALSIAKIYTFRRDSYLINLHYEVQNDSEEPWVGRLYGQFLRAEVAPEGGLFRTYTYTGGVISGPEKPYEKIEFSDMAKQMLERESGGGWVAMIQHYFASAWIPDQATTNRFYSLEPDGARHVLGLMTPSIRVPPGGSGVLQIGLYAGPKIQSRMKAAAPNLQRAVDYGWLWVIAQPLFWLLAWIHGVVGNWGWSIIILTLLVKLAFFHLSAASYKSMARMRKVQPRIMALRERYGSEQGADEPEDDGTLQRGED